MSKVLITGGAGFIGSHLVEELLKRGYEVAVIDNMSTGSMNNLYHCIEDDTDLNVIKGDITCDEDIEDAINGAEYVFHLAAIRSVPRSIDEPIAVNRANVTGTLKVLEACRKREVKRVIYAGSSSVYGEGNGPISPYAVSKSAGGDYCRAYSKVFGLETIELRYFNVFGPRQSPESTYAPVIPKFIDLAIKGHPLPIYGDGHQAKDFTHVDNVVHANILAMEAEKTDGKAVNIGCGNAVKILDVAHRIWGLCHPGIPEVPISFGSPRTGDVRHSKAMLEDNVGIDYEPVTDFDKGLRKTIEWYRSEEGIEWLKT